MKRHLRTFSPFLVVVLLSLLLSVFISCGDTAAAAAATTTIPQSIIKNNNKRRRPQLDDALSPFGIVGKINSGGEHDGDDASSKLCCVRGGDCCDSTPISDALAMP